MLGSSSSSSKGGGNNNYDYSFKILLIGDSGVGKSSLLVTFISNFVHDLSPTIGNCSTLSFDSFIFFLPSFCILLVGFCLWDSHPEFALNFQKKIFDNNFRKGCFYILDWERIEDKGLKWILFFCFVNCLGSLRWGKKNEPANFLSFKLK